jgi:uncharacterized protein involved in high-affinity Fe2+ transport
MVVHMDRAPSQTSGFAHEAGTGYMVVSSAELRRVVDSAVGEGPRGLAAVADGSHYGRDRRLSKAVGTVAVAVRLTGLS